MRLCDKASARQPQAARLTVTAEGERECGIFHSTQLLYLLSKSLIIHGHPGLEKSRGGGPVCFKGGPDESGGRRRT